MEGFHDEDEAEQQRFGLRTAYDEWGSEARAAWCMLPDDECHEFRATGIDLHTHFKEWDCPSNQDGP